MCGELDFALDHVASEMSGGHLGGCTSGEVHIVVPLSSVSLFYDQLRSENITQKIPEINNPRVFNCGRSE